MRPERRWEAVGHTLRPGVVASRSQLEDDAVTASRASRTRGAIQVARGVADESPDGTASVGCAFETVEQALSPRVVPVGQLVHRADVMGSAIVSGAVEISGSVENQAPVGQCTVRLIFESIERLQDPCAGVRAVQFEGNAVSIRATDGCHTVEISSMIKNKPSGGARRAIYAAGEGVDNAKRPIAGRAGSKLIDNAEPISSSGWSHAVEIAGLVKGEPAPRTRAIAAGEGMDHGSPSRLH